MSSTLNMFHPLIQKWFSNRFQQPTDIQNRSWPSISSRKHVLITAPTGSGKTLTAFLWAIDQLAQGKHPPERTSVLYVSPLKALNNDIQRNLMGPLSEIRAVFEKEDVPFPAIKVLTRSGDTSQEERRKMVRHPPEILITTPESLNLMLSSKSGMELLYHISTVILDEIHAVAGNKRGVHLITAVERLVRFSGEFQRICLSATVKDLETVAAFTAGFQLKGSALDPEYIPRTMELIESRMEKQHDIQVRFPPKEEERDGEVPVWDVMARFFKEIVEKNRSTLFFTNGRRLCEKLTYKINKLSGQPLAYSHHGSLSKELRQNVEKRLKQGDLKAIVATSSLEMGIDIGELDEVILVQSPPSISSAVQRVGRSGHHVNQKSRGTLFPAHPHDLIASAVLAKAVKEQNIESITPVRCPLDILAQMIISMAGIETWDLDELYTFLRTSWPYRHLTRQQYDLVLNMLAGRYSDARIRELKPRVSIDRLDNTVTARKGALLALYMSGGTIPDRGYFQLRHHETNARIGELDEEYVWEAKIGQIATIGTQNWKIKRITHNDVLATPVGNRMMDAPFWIAEEMNRDVHFSEKILLFLETANELLGQDTFKTLLEQDYCMDENAVLELIRFLKKQKEKTASDLPHRHHLLLEYVRSGPDGGPGSMLVIHTLWGGRVNRPFAMALEAAWEERYAEKPEIFPGNDAVVVQLADPIDPEEILSLVTSAKVEELIRSRLEGSGFFSARFRECAGRALLVTRKKINQRMPLWMTRLRSQKLLENTTQYKDFPILLETWRTCLQDEFDIARLKNLLDELDTGRIQWSCAHTATPSPFAAGMAWNQINQYMYQHDQPASSSSALENHLIRDVVFSPNLRPTVSKAIIHKFEEKRHRLAPGYAPQSPMDLLDWVKERVAIPANEWKQLLNAVNRDGNEEANEILASIEHKLVTLEDPAMDEPLIISLELAPNVIDAWYKENPDIKINGLSGISIQPESFQNFQQPPDEEIDTALLLINQWISFYGPRPIEFMKISLGLEERLVDTMVESLVETQAVISGSLVKNTGTVVCNSENFEILLRLSREEAKPEFSPLDIKFLPLFLAHFQGLTRPADSVDTLFQKMEPLVCLPLPAEAWEQDILPARATFYQTSWLDTLMQEGDLCWLGFQKQRAAFYFRSDLDLLGHEKESGQTEVHPEFEPVFQTGQERYDFTAMMRMTNINSAELSDAIWQEVWKSNLSNDTFAALRKGVEINFKAPKTIETSNTTRFGRQRPGSRSSFSKWRGSLPFAGFWYRPEKPAPETDLLEKEELNKDRVRLLMDRYGLVFRELLERELPAFRWAAVFRSLRLMELSGEVLAGYFFEEISGPQFISQKAYRKLQTALPEQTIFWISATDPVSVCGLPFDSLKSGIPRRIASNHLVYKGSDLVLISQRNGKELTIHLSHDDDRLTELYAPLRHLLHRPVKPLKNITVETINDEPAAASRYAESLKTVFDVLIEFKKVILYKKM